MSAILYCELCGATLPQKFNGKCPGCKRKTKAIDYYPTLTNTLNHETTAENHTLQATPEAMQRVVEHEKKALESLKEPKLLFNIVKEIQKEGVIGEENTILCLIAKIMLRLVENATPTSSNIIVSDETGGGKDFVVGAVCRVTTPPGRYLHRTDISDKAFDYWLPPQGTWDGCVIHIEDPREELIQGQSLKVLASGGTHTTKVVDHKAETHEIQGKPVLIITSLSSTVQLEGMRRWDALRLDTSKTLTRIILSEKLKQATGKNTKQPDESLRYGIQNHLKRKSVMIPFSEQLIGHLPDTLPMRTQADKLLDYVKASAVLHQHQRKTDEDTGHILATIDDYDFASFVFTQLKDVDACPLNKDEEELLAVLKTARSPLPVRDILSRYNRHGKTWFYDHLDDFKAKRLIQEMSEWDDASNKEITKYYLSDEYQSGSLPAVSQLFYDDRTTTQREENDEKKSVVSVVREMYMYIDLERQKVGLSPLFMYSENNQNNQNNNIYITGGNRSCVSFRTTANCQKQPPHEQLAELRDYCERVQNNGRNITRANLEYHFDPLLIERAITDQYLVRKPDGNYTIASTSFDMGGDVQ